MKFQLDQVLVEERERFQLKLCCEDCVLFDPREGGSCVHGYPTWRHRAASMVEGAEVYFCKEFCLV
ncbi:MAG: hypothetical protein H5U40_02310 [Polyangiaceae bacterium]|nr:hypothetical protein [Polyangiaceae bacterium]